MKEIPLEVAVAQAAKAELHKAEVKAVFDAAAELRMYEGNSLGHWAMRSAIISELRKTLHEKHELIWACICKEDEHGV